MQKRKNVLKPVYWLVLFSLLVHIVLPQPLHAAGETVEIQIENFASEEAAWSGILNTDETTRTVDWQEGMTALEALESYATAQNITLETSDGQWGTMLHAINGVGDSFVPEGALWSYWNFKLNGADAFSGLDSTILEAGDIVHLSYQISYPSIQVAIENNALTTEEGAPWTGEVPELDYQGEVYYTLPGAEGLTLLDVIETYTTNNAITLLTETGENGSVINSINDLNLQTVDSTRNPRWEVEVNGEVITTALESTIMQPADDIVIRFLVDAKTIETETPVEETPVLPEVEAWWPSFRQNENNNAALVGLDAATNEEEAELLWSANFAPSTWSDFPSQGTIINNQYVFTSGSTLYALDLTNGTVQKQAQLSSGQGYASTAPLYAEGRIFVALDNGTVDCFQASNFEKLWTTEYSGGGQSQTPLSYTDSSLIVQFYSPSGEGTMLRLNAVSGEIIWEKTSPNGYYFAGGVVSDTYFISGSENASIDVVNISNGETVSSLSTGAKVRSTVVAENGHYYLADNEGTLYQFTVDANGQISLLNSLALTSPVTATPVILNDRIYLASMNSIFVIDQASMQLLDTIAIEGYAQGSPVVISPDNKNVIYFTLNQMPGALYAVSDNLDGSFSEVSVIYTPEADAQNYNLGSPIVSADGTLIYKNDSGTIFAIRKKVVDKVEETSSTSTSESTSAPSVTTTVEPTTTVTTSSETTSTTFATTNTEETDESSTATVSISNTNSTTPEATKDADDEVVKTGEDASTFKIALILLAVAVLIIIIAIIIRRKNQ